MRQRQRASPSLKRRSQIGCAQHVVRISSVGQIVEGPANPGTQVAIAYRAGDRLQDDGLGRVGDKPGSIREHLPIETSRSERVVDSTFWGEAAKNVHDVGQFDDVHQFLSHAVTLSENDRWRYDNVPKK